jgi:GxxExxY protein
LSFFLKSTNRYFAKKRMMEGKENNKLIYQELSYKIIGCAFEVFNEMGPGHSERLYQQSLAVAFKTKELKYKEQVYYFAKFKDRIVGKCFLDFIVEDKVVIEIKKSGVFIKPNIEQVLNYLKMSELSLAILIHFTKDGVKSKRIINTNQPMKPANP